MSHGVFTVTQWTAHPKPETTQIPLLIPILIYIAASNNTLHYFKILYNLSNKFWRKMLQVQATAEYATGSIFIL